MDLRALAKLIADNLPSPHALDDAWRQTNEGAAFDLSQADSETVREWLALAEAVSNALRPTSD